MDRKGQYIGEGSAATLLPVGGPNQMLPFRPRVPLSKRGSGVATKIACLQGHGAFTGVTQQPAYVADKVQQGWP